MPQIVGVNGPVRTGQVRVLASEVGRPFSRGQVAPGQSTRRLLKPVAAQRPYPQRAVLSCTDQASGPGPPRVEGHGCHQSLMAIQDQRRGPRRIQVPHPHCAVLPCTGEASGPGPERVEGDGADPAVMAAQHQRLGPRGIQVPHPYRAVAPRAGQAPGPGPLRVEGHGADPAVMAAQYQRLGPGGIELPISVPLRPSPHLPAARLVGRTQAP